MLCDILPALGGAPDPVAGYDASTAPRSESCSDAAMASPTSSRTVVIAALAGNLLVAATKFVAAVLICSSSMYSEGVHSLVDTLNEVLLLYGMRRAARQPDPVHP